MAVKHKQGVPISPEQKERVAELIGLDLTYDETAGAIGISVWSVERILKDPVYRKKADDIKRARDSAAAEFSSIVRGMMTATNADGTPDTNQQRIGAELYGKHPGLVDAEAIDADDSLLPGVILLFPNENVPDRSAPLEFSPDEMAPVADEAAQEG